MVLIPATIRNAGRRVSCTGHRRLASGFAFGRRQTIRVSRGFLNLALCGPRQAAASHVTLVAKHPLVKE